MPIPLKMLWVNCIPKLSEIEAWPLGKVNYLGASPRGIRRKQIFNFEASLGVLNPLAVPININK
ncbi:hypothetical protein BFP75_00195 [Maribacter sp. 4G9]|nr:hypothetical protein BFP75_00195 [Maribacter sp. 4G9]